MDNDGNIYIGRSTSAINMDTLEFRKFLTEYGYTYDQYQELEQKEKDKIRKKFKTQNVSNKMGDVGKGIQGCGCVLILLPILAILIYFIIGLF